LASFEKDYTGMHGQQNKKKTQKVGFGGDVYLINKQ